MLLINRDIRDGNWLSISCFGELYLVNLINNISVSSITRYAIGLNNNSTVYAYDCNIRAHNLLYGNLARALMACYTVDATLSSSSFFFLRSSLTRAPTANKWPRNATREVA